VNFALFAEENFFIGRWFWSYNGSAISAPKNRYKEFTKNGDFYNWENKNGQWVNTLKNQKYIFDKKIIIFYDEKDEYKYTYEVIVPFTMIALLDLEIQENPAIYCFKFF